MTVKTTGEEWLRFYNDKSVWDDDDAWHEDECFIVNGEENYPFDEMKPSDIISLSGGVYYPHRDARASETLSLETVFKRWHKEQSISAFAIVVKNEEVSKFKEIAKEHGWKVK